MRGSAWLPKSPAMAVRAALTSTMGKTNAGGHRSLAKILSIASAPMVITGRIW